MSLSEAQSPGVDPRFDRDWPALLASAIGLMFSVGAVTIYPFGVFMGPIGKEFGWTRGQMSGAISIGQVALVVSTILWGILLDRFGPRRMLLSSIVGLGIGLTLLSRLTGPLWHLYAVFTILPLLAAADNPLGYNGVLVRRFQKRLGLALGLSLMGVGMGAALLPLLAQRSIAAFGWRSAYLALAATVVLVGMPAAWTATRFASGPVVRTANVAPIPLMPFLRSRAFLLICGTFFLLGTAGTGVLTHLVPMMTDRGIPPDIAAKLAGLVGISTLVSRGAVGWLLDRFHAPYMVAAVGLLCAVLCLLLTQPGGTSLCAAAAILLGLIAGAEVDFIGFLIRKQFGAVVFGRLYGIAFAAYAIGPGAALIGYSFDHFHAYRPGLLLFAGLSALAAMLAFAMPRNLRSDSDSNPQTAKWPVATQTT